MKKLLADANRLTWEEFTKRIKVLRRVDSSKKKIYYKALATLNGKLYVAEMVIDKQNVLIVEDIKYIDQFVHDELTNNIAKQLENAGLLI